MSQSKCFSLETPDGRQIAVMTITADKIELEKKQLALTSGEHTFIIHIPIFRQMREVK